MLDTTRGISALIVMKVALKHRTYTEQMISCAITAPLERAASQTGSKMMISHVRVHPVTLPTYLYRVRLHPNHCDICKAHELDRDISRSGADIENPLSWFEM